MSDDSFVTFITSWDLLGPMSFVVWAAIAAYLAGMVRLARRGHGAFIAPRKQVAAILGLGLMAFSLAGPLDVYATRAFTVHMAQHLVLAMFAAPLLLAASPVAVYLWALPEPLRSGMGQSLAARGWLRRAGQALVQPWIALIIFVLTFYLWHLPTAYGAALENAAVHFIQHATMFGAGVLFWWPLMGPAPLRTELSYPRRLLHLLLAVTPKALLAAIITLAGHPFYDFYVEAPDLWGMTDREDQTIAGLLMWIPGNLVFLAALTVLFFKWYEKEEGPLKDR
jgi:cytochrome c oxidase assembly factor CtaG